MGRIIELAKPIKCGIAYQGGAALCAFNAGAATVILDRTDIFDPIIVTGTSAGGLNALKTVEALAKNFLPSEALLYLWHDMAQFQKDNLSPLHYGAASVGNHAKQLLAIDSWHQATLESCMRMDNLWQRDGHALTDSYRFLADFYSQSAAFFVEALARPQRSKPLMKFLTRHPFDFAAINASPIECTINASRFDGRNSIWSLPATQEALFSNRMNGGLDIRYALASGSLHHMMPPETIDGTDYHDGGYLANPNLTDIASKCNKEGAILFVLRTRPTQAYKLSEELSGTAAWASAFFNKKLDDDLRRVRREYPYLKVCVIEPENLERGLIHGLTPEMQFSRDTVCHRFADGQVTAQRTLRVFLQKHFPLHHTMLSADVNQKIPKVRRRMPPQLHAVAR